MNEQVIAPIIERINRNKSKESIKEEMLGFGYTSEEFETAYESVIEILSKKAREEMSEETKKHSVNHFTQQTPKVSETSPDTSQSSKKILLLAIASLLLAILGIVVLVLLLIQAQKTPTVDSKSTTITNIENADQAIEKTDGNETVQVATSTLTTQPTQTFLDKDASTVNNGTSSIVDSREDIHESSENTSEATTTQH